MTTPLSGIGPVVVPLAEGPSKSNTLTQKSCNPCGQGVENNPGVYRISNPDPHLLSDNFWNKMVDGDGVVVFCGGGVRSSSSPPLPIPLSGRTRLVVLQLGYLFLPKFRASMSLLHCQTLLKKRKKQTNLIFLAP